MYYSSDKILYNLLRVMVGLKFDQFEQALLIVELTVVMVLAVALAISPLLAPPMVALLAHLALVALLAPLLVVLLAHLALVQFLAGFLG